MYVLLGQWQLHFILVIIHSWRSVWRLQVGGTGVLVSPMTYIFDEEPARWRKLLDTLGQD